MDPAPKGMELVIILASLHDDRVLGLLCPVPQGIFSRWLLEEISLFPDNQSMTSRLFTLPVITNEL
jgi:hypothetical protein